MLYEKLGPGAHPCHWCGMALRWKVGQRDSDALCADHLDGDTLNDAPSNVVASCRGCNANRALGIERLRPRPCEECGTDFMPKRGRSRFCSLECSSVATVRGRGWPVTGGGHGTRSRYVGGRNTKGCRCYECKAAAAAYNRAYYQQRKAAP